MPVIVHGKVAVTTESVTLLVVNVLFSVKIVLSIGRRVLTTADVRLLLTPMINNISAE